uniref:PiggyBac transposable element-derived protein domain-containing protein n=1 Tax=Lutzomyia longipalpis TaxID=7200 RepID=A0A1B0C8C5_LUTLO
MNRFRDISHAIQHVELESEEEMEVEQYGEGEGETSDDDAEEDSYEEGSENEFPPCPPEPEQEPEYLNYDWLNEYYQDNQLNSLSDEECSVDLLPESPVVFAEDEANGEFFTSKKDGTKWKKTACVVSRKPPSHNVIRGPVDKVRTPEGNLQQDPVYYLMLYLNDIIPMLTFYTNMEAERVLESTGREWKQIDDLEMGAFIGLLYLNGILGLNNRPTKTIWGRVYGVNIFRATMSRTRFKNILRFLRFDNCTARKTSKPKDKLAPIREVWEIFDCLLAKYYIPGENLTIDEQLVDYRGKCPFKQHMPSKPGKYGLKIFWLNDASTGYPLKSLPYLGKNADQRAKNVGANTVLQLAEIYFGTNRNITVDNFFTSLDLAKCLKENGLTICGTVRMNKTFIPEEFLDCKSREVYSSIFGFSKDFTIVSYTPKKRKCVILLSSMHHNGRVSGPKQIPDIILHYNSTKAGTDRMDQMIGNYSCRRSNRRWPMRYFMNLLDVAGLAAFIVHQKKFPSQSRNTDKRRVFLQAAAEGMIWPHINRRNSRSAAEIWPTEEGTGKRKAKPERGRRGYCHICGIRTMSVCSKCKKNTCVKHIIKLCNKCK